MKNFLIIVGTQSGIIATRINDYTKTMIRDLLKTGAFDYIISTNNGNDEDELIDYIMSKSNHIVHKNAYSVYSEDLAELIKNENGGEFPESVFILGFNTESCVLMTAADFFEAGINPIVLANYCASLVNEDVHLAGLKAIESIIGSKNVCRRFIYTKQDLEKMLDFARESVCQLSSSKESALVDILCKKKWKISFAESCTGGMAAARLVNVPNASHVLDVSFVTYANEAKIKYLNVSIDTIKECGVVNEDIAIQMAIGVADAAGAQVGVGISGIAGPKGATPVKPVGMVCFGFYIDGKVYSYTKQFGSVGRNSVRNASVDFVYDTLLKILKN